MHTRNLLMKPLLLSLLFTGCKTPTTPTPEPQSELQVACAESGAGLIRPPGWESASHCKHADPDYDRVFGTGEEVGTLTLTVSENNSAFMEDDFTDLLREAGWPEIIPLDPPNRWFTACTGAVEEAPCSTLFSGPGVCREDPLDGLFCLPDRYQACENTGLFQSCTINAEPGLCLNDFENGGLQCIEEYILFGSEGPGGGLPPPWNPVSSVCDALSAGSVCTHDNQEGVCTAVPSLPSLRTCAIDGLGDASETVDTPEASAAPFWERKPAYVPVDVQLDDVTWTQVGLRYKGNNGLATSIEGKRPLRLKFDHFEDLIPAITDQRLYGFKEFSLASNGTDPSFLNQHAAATAFRMMGVHAPATVPVQVVLEVAGERRSLGLYTLSEIPGKPLLDQAFGQHDGNLYKPDGRGAHFAEFVEASFHKKNNHEAADFSDVQAFIAALNAPNTARQAWRDTLEATFDMPAFIRFAAVNQAIGNWDTYGGYAHNYYLYADQETARLTFLPWDFDLAFAPTGPSDLSLETFDGRWPLFRAITRDPVYAAAYHQELETVYAELFVDDQLLDQVVAFRAAVAPFAVNDPAAEAFPTAADDLEAHLRSQRVALETYLTLRGVLP